MSDRLNFWNNDVRYYLHDDGGYIGRSMSNRAERAYKIGEAPWSKWTKEKIIDVIVGEKAKVLDEKIAYLNGFVVEVEDEEEVEKEVVEVADPEIDEPKATTDPQPPFGFGNVRL